MPATLKRPVEKLQRLRTTRHYEQRQADDSDLMIRFYDLLMDQAQADARRRGADLDDKDIHLLDAFAEADFERLMKQAARQ